MKLMAANKYHLIQRCKERGYTLEEVMPCVVNSEGDVWMIDIDHKAYPSQKREVKTMPLETEPEVTIVQGVGTELKKLLSYINIKATPNCSCNKRARYMDDKGIEWCKSHKDLICSWLKEEAAKRKLPFIPFAGQKLIDMAIHRAERKQ